jgi:hypothetical protein
MCSLILVLLLLDRNQCFSYLEFLSCFSNAFAMFETYACYFNYLSKVKACVCPYDLWFNYVLVMFNWSFFTWFDPHLQHPWCLLIPTLLVFSRWSHDACQCAGAHQFWPCHRILKVELTTLQPHQQCLLCLDKSLVYPVLFLCYLADWPWCHDMLLFWVQMWYWSNGVNIFVLESCRASVWEYVLHYVWLIWFACLLS